MEDQSEPIRHILLSCFEKVKRAVEANREMYVCVYRTNPAAQLVCQISFCNLFSDTLLRFGRTNTMADDQLKGIPEADRCVPINEISEKLNSSKTTISDRIKRMRFVEKLDIWIPHIKEEHLPQRINICGVLLKRN